MGNGVNGKFTAASAPDTGDAATRARQDFAKLFADTIAAGKPVRIFFDNDGTLFPFVSDPKHVRMDPACFSALVRLTQFGNVQATSLTGRDVKTAGTGMLVPGYQVKDSGGHVLARANSKKLRFGVIGSHGVEYMEPDGTIQKYDFGPETDEFIRHFKYDAAELRAQFPGITIEDDKHGAVGINVSTIRGEELRAQALKAAKRLLEAYAKAPTNPVHPKTGQKIFQVRREGDHELELRPVGFGKDFGILTFGDADHDALTLFCCDSLNEGGTDVDAAQLVNNKDAFPNGHVLMVLNGRNQPPPAGSPHAAALVFHSPSDLGEFLSSVATDLETRPKPAPAPKGRKLHVN